MDVGRSDRRRAVVGCCWQTGLQFCVEALVAVQRLKKFLVLHEGNGAPPPGVTDKVRGESLQLFTFFNCFPVFLVFIFPDENIVFLVNR